MQILQKEDHRQIAGSRAKILRQILAGAIAQLLRIVAQGKNISAGRKIEAQQLADKMGAQPALLPFTQVKSDALFHFPAHHLGRIIFKDLEAESEQVAQQRIGLRLAGRVRPALEIQYRIGI